jgi:hypothetical protein
VHCGMRGLFSKADLRVLSLILASVMLLGSAPSTAGFVIVSGPSHAELTINICQPLQTFDLVSGVLLARPAAILPEFILRDLGSAVAKSEFRLVDFKIAPDTPPPKRPV